METIAKIEFDGREVELVDEPVVVHRYAILANGERITHQNGKPVCLKGEKPMMSSENGVKDALDMHIKRLGAEKVLRLLLSEELI